MRVLRLKVPSFLSCFHDMFIIVDPNPFELINLMLKVLCRYKSLQEPILVSVNVTRWKCTTDDICWPCSDVNNKTSVMCVLFRGPFLIFVACVAVCSIMTVYFAIILLRLGGFSWIYSIGLLQFIVVSALMSALFIFIVSKTLLSLIHK